VSKNPAEAGFFVYVAMNNYPGSGGWQRTAPGRFAVLEEAWQIGLFCKNMTYLYLQIDLDQFNWFFPCFDSANHQPASILIDAVSTATLSPDYS